MQEIVNNNKSMRQVTLSGGAGSLQKERQKHFNLANATQIIHAITKEVLDCWSLELLVCSIIPFVRDATGFQLRI